MTENIDELIPEQESPIALKRFLTWEVFAATGRHKYFLGIRQGYDPGEESAVLDFPSHVSEESGMSLGEMFRRDFFNGSYKGAMLLCQQHCGSSCAGYAPQRQESENCPLSPAERSSIAPKWFDP